MALLRYSLFVELCGILFVLVDQVLCTVMINEWMGMLTSYSPLTALLSNDRPFILLWHRITAPDVEKGQHLLLE